MKILNSMNHTHDNKANNISECNLLNDILNPSKLTKNINNHYYPILHGYINNFKGRKRGMQSDLGSQFEPSYRNYVRIT